MKFESFGALFGKTLLFLIGGLLIGGVVLPLLLFGVVGLCLSLGGEPVITETTDLTHYGTITGNSDNATPWEFVYSFFPEEISEDFSNVTYLYTAKNLDTYACQVWLEFDMENEDKFTELIEGCTTPEQTTVFSYDPAYMVYTVSDYFQLNPDDADREFSDIPIRYAKIGKILYNAEKRHVIFYALCLYDGGGTTLETLGDFFTRFGIDPFEYERTFADPYYQEHVLSKRSN